MTRLLYYWEKFFRIMTMSVKSFSPVKTSIYKGANWLRKLAKMASFCFKNIRSSLLYYFTTSQPPFFPKGKSREKHRKSVICVEFSLPLRSNTELFVSCYRVFQILCLFLTLLKPGRSRRNLATLSLNSCKTLVSCWESNITAQFAIKRLALYFYMLLLHQLSSI